MFCLLYIDGKKTIQLASLIRMLYCCFCSKMTVGQKRIQDDCVYCKFCCQKSCLKHIYDMDPIKYNNNRNEVLTWSKEKRLDWVCLGCEAPEYVERRQTVKFYISLCHTIDLHKMLVIM